MRAVLENDVAFPTGHTYNGPHSVDALGRGVLGVKMEMLVRGFIFKRHVSRSGSRQDYNHTLLLIAFDCGGTTHSISLTSTLLDNSMHILRAVSYFGAQLPILYCINYIRVLI